MSHPPWPPDHVLTPDEITALVGEGFRKDLEQLSPVMLRALSDWILVGYSLFRDGRLPPLRAVVGAAHRVLLASAYRRYDKNITHMAKALGCSRRAGREMLRKYGLYEPLVRVPVEMLADGGAEDEAEDEDDDTIPIRVKGTEGD